MTVSLAKNQQQSDPPLPERIPHHVAIIMDGNGRWAKARGLPRAEGHRQGTENLRRIIRACDEFGVDILTIYAFSTEINYTPQCSYTIYIVYFLFKRTRGFKKVPEKVL